MDNRSQSCQLSLRMEQTELGLCGPAKFRVKSAANSPWVWMSPGSRPGDGHSKEGAGTTPQNWLWCHLVLVQSVV